MAAVRVSARKRLAVFAAGLAAALPAAAVTFPNLYRVTVQPDPAAADQRAAAIDAAFAQLLVRVTGLRAAATDPNLADLVGDAQRFTNSYGLDRQGRPLVGFNATLVDQALAARGLPVCGPERPLTAIWLAVDDGVGGRALLSSDVGNDSLTPELADELAALRTELTQVADERGLPIVLPLLDIEDLTAVSFTDVWGGFEDRVVAGSARYRADAVLIGRLRPGELAADLQWLLVKDGQRLALAGGTLREGLDAAADLYCEELAVRGEGGLTRLTVRDVVSAADYGRVMRYLEGLSVLASVDVESFAAGELNLRVAARGDSAVIERVLALGGVLRRDGASAGPLVFRVARSDSGP